MPVAGPGGDLRSRIVAAVDRTFAEQVRLSFLRRGAVDADRPARDIRALLRVGGGDERNLSGGMAQDWSTRIAAGKAELHIDRSAYQRKQQDSGFTIKVPEFLGGVPAPEPSLEKKAELARDQSDRERRATSSNPIEAVQARAAIGALGGTLPPQPPRRGPDPVRRAIGAAEAVGEEQANLDQAKGLPRSYYGKRLTEAKAKLAELSTGLPEAARQGLDAYAAAVAAGGGQVTDQARRIGETLRSALSVTATPQVDTSGLDAAQAKVDRLHQSLRALPGAVEGARLNAQRTADDYDDVNADIEN